ncbi:hypothetical protein [Methanococcus voltae]|uniref:Cellulosome anchoring protein cohesin region n=1 Tax=Methanococcus voltae (strain ATCC BAA-1334 / A3) TaxID=456320 RepID=D7DTP0_METV3|nr:hypothetical protein [Methanococcus voltae]MCS3901354.1 hypothetical protein [Methanococcus voltae]
MKNIKISLIMGLILLLGLGMSVVSAETPEDSQNSNFNVEVIPSTDLTNISVGQTFEITVKYDQSIDDLAGVETSLELPGSLEIISLTGNDHLKELATEQFYKLKTNNNIIINSFVVFDGTIDKSADLYIVKVKANAPGDYYSLLKYEYSNSKGDSTPTEYLKSEINVKGEETSDKGFIDSLIDMILSIFK